jgi:hypothetical protein
MRKRAGPQTYLERYATSPEWRTAAGSSAVALGGSWATAGTVSACRVSGPGRSKSPQTKAPTAKNPAVHQKPVV